MADPASSTVSTPVNNTPDLVPVISPEGKFARLPRANFAAAQQQGFQSATQMVSPEGKSAWLPEANVDKARSQGFKLPGEAPVGQIGARQDNPITHPINYLDEVSSDIRTGSGLTFPGRVLRFLGARGTETGNSAGVASTVGGPAIGPVKALRGALRVAHGVGQDLSQPFDPTARMNPEVVGGANEALEGVGQAAAPIAGVTNPAFLPTVARLGLVQKGIEKGASALGASPQTAELAGNIGAIGAGGAESNPEAIEKIKSTVPAAVREVPGKVAEAARSAYGIANPDALTAEQSATKAIKPRNSKVNWKTEVNSALPDVRRSVDNLGIDIDNASLEDVEHATLQAKKDVWGEYQNKFTKPNEGVNVDTSPVADTIRSTVSQRTLEQNPGLADRINKIADTYQGRQLSIADLEDRIQELNRETRGIEARYPADKAAAKDLPENAPTFAERNSLKNLLISKLDEIEGPGAQDLRTRYGALNSFMDALQRRKAVYERQNPQSLGEQIGRFEGVGQMVRGAARAMAGDVGSGGADIVGGIATRMAAKAGRQINDSQFLLRQALRKTTPRPAIVPRVTPEYVQPPAPAALPGRVSGFLPRGVYNQAQGTPPAATPLLEHMEPTEGEYVQPPAPAVNVRGALKPGVYAQRGGFEPNQPALPAYRGIPLRPSTANVTPANTAEPAVRVPLESNAAQGSTVPRPGPRPAEQLPGRVPGRASGSNQPQRATQSQTGGAYGTTTQVLTSGADLPGRYRVVEADDLVPSHNAGTFAQNPNYPEGVQERTYHSSKEAQARVIQQAQNYDPRYTVNTNPDAVNGPPIVTKDGIVLGGNSRAMSTQRLYAAGRGDLYRNALVNQASSFGLDPQAIAKMQKPVLVREISNPQGGLEGMRRVAADLNKNMTGALSVEEKAVSAGRSVSPGTLDAIGDLRNSIGEDASLRDVLRKAGGHVLNMLIHDGAITERERPQLVDTATGGLSEEGKTFVERALLGSVVDDPGLMEKTPKNILDKVGSSLGDLAKLGAREDEYNILPLIREAMSDHAEMAASGLDLNTYLAQQGMFGKPRSEAVDALVRTLAKRPQQARLALRQFGQDAAFNQPGQGTLALTEQPSAARSFNDAFGTNLSDEQYLDALRDSMMKEPAATDDQARAEGQKQAVDRAKEAVRGGRIEEALALRDLARRPELEPAELQNHGTREMHQTNGEYTTARKALHRNLIADTGIGSNLQKADPTLVILGGGAASGKSHLARAASLKYPDAVKIDPDGFKAGIPEYELLQKSDPLGAAARVHEESSDISKQAVNEAMANRHDIIIDAVSGNAEKTAQMIDRFRRAGYRIETHFADRPVNEALAGMVARFERNGRWVPPDVLMNGHGGAAQTFERVAPIADESSLSMAKPGGGHQLVYENGNIYNEAAFNQYRAKGAQHGGNGNHSQVLTPAR